MSKGKGHIPIRMCIVCRTKRPKFELIRLTVDKNGFVRRDDKGKLGGRGAYVCPNEKCIKELMKKPQLLCRALRKDNIKFDEPIGGIYEQNTDIRVSKRA